MLEESGWGGVAGLGGLRRCLLVTSEGAMLVESSCACITVVSGELISCVSVAPGAADGVLD